MICHTTSWNNQMSLIAFRPIYASIPNWFSEHKDFFCSTFYLLFLLLSTDPYIHEYLNAVSKHTNFFFSLLSCSIAWFTSRGIYMWVPFPIWVAWVLSIATVFFIHWPIFREVSHWWKKKELLGFCAYCSDKDDKDLATVYLIWNFFWFPTRN
jgi:hypothetical protein